MLVNVSNTITVYNPTPELVAWCKKNLVIPNPEYAQKLRMHFWLGNTPEKLWLYEVRGNSLVLPFGVLRAIYPYIGGGQVTTTFRQPVDVDYNCDVPLYDYQEKAVNAVINEYYGILPMSTEVVYKNL